MFQITLWWVLNGLWRVFSWALLLWWVRINFLGLHFFNFYSCVLCWEHFLAAYISYFFSATLWTSYSLHLYFYSLCVNLYSPNFFFSLCLRRYAYCSFGNWSCFFILFLFRPYWQSTCCISARILIYLVQCWIFTTKEPIQSLGRNWLFDFPLVLTKYVL